MDMGEGELEVLELANVDLRLSRSPARLCGTTVASWCHVGTKHICLCTVLSKHLLMDVRDSFQHSLSRKTSICGFKKSLTICTIGH